MGWELPQDSSGLLFARSSSSRARSRCCCDTTSSSATSCTWNQDDKNREAGTQSQCCSNVISLCRCSRQRSCIQKCHSLHISCIFNTILSSTNKILVQPQLHGGPVAVAGVRDVCGVGECALHSSGTRWGRAALAHGLTGHGENWGQEPDLEPASSTRAGRTCLPWKTLRRGSLVVCWDRVRGTASPRCLSLRFPAGNRTRAGLICRACASALPFSLKQFPCPLAS